MDFNRAHLAGTVDWLTRTTTQTGKPMVILGLRAGGTTVKVVAFGDVAAQAETLKATQRAVIHGRLAAWDGETNVVADRIAPELATAWRAAEVKAWIASRPGIKTGEATTCPA